MCDTYRVRRVDSSHFFAPQGSLNEFVTCNDVVLSALLENAGIADALIFSDNVPRMNEV